MLRCMNESAGNSIFKAEAARVKTIGTNQQRASHNLVDIFKYRHVTVPRLMLEMDWATTVAAATPVIEPSLTERTESPRFSRPVPATARPAHFNP